MRFARLVVAVFLLMGIGVVIVAQKNKGVVLLGQTGSQCPPSAPAGTKNCGDYLPNGSLCKANGLACGQTVPCCLNGSVTPGSVSCCSAQGLVCKNGPNRVCGPSGACGQNGQSCGSASPCCGGLHCDAQTLKCVVPVCGNGTREGSEFCDDGNQNPNDACKNDCTANFCGDGVVRNVAPVEECDDGAANGTPGSNCNDTCHVAICGDGVVQGDEQCDDGTPQQPPNGPRDNCVSCQTADVVVCCTDWQTSTCSTDLYDYECPGNQTFNNVDSCALVCRPGDGGGIGNSISCWVPTCPAGMCFSDENCGTGSYATESDCVEATYDICEDGFATIGGTNGVAGGGGGNNNGGGTNGGTTGGTGTSGGSSANSSADDDPKTECGRDQCVTVTSCTFTGGECGVSCGGTDGKPAGCCCGQKKNALSGASSQTSATNTSTQTSFALSSSSRSQSSSASSAAVSVSSQCSLELTFGCALCPQGIPARFLLNAEGFVATNLSACQADPECASRNMDQAVLEYRGDCQWVTASGGPSCSGEDVADWDLRLDRGVDDGIAISIFERGGAVYNGWMSFCGLPSDISLSTEEGVCGAGHAAVELNQACVSARSVSSSRSASTSRSSARLSISSRMSALSTPRSSVFSSRTAASSAAAVLSPSEACPVSSHCPSSKCRDGLCMCGTEADCPEEQSCMQGVCRSALCGNGIVEPGETCDDANSLNNDGCTNACQAPVCGDGIVSGREQCDDGVYNSTGPDSCRPSCTLPSCGDGSIDAGESCDDGNRDTNDACDNNCTLGLEEACTDDVECASDLCVDGLCREKNICGNGVREDKEWCDDGNTDEDTCTVSCLLSDGQICTLSKECASSVCRKNHCVRAGVCGDGITDALLGEECDQGEANSNIIANRCRRNCRLAYLGDGVLDRGEECDDGNLIDGDGCSSLGRLEQVAANPIILELPQFAQALHTGAPFASTAPLIGGLIGQGSASVPVANPQTGPAAVLFMVSGAAGGLAWMRRRRM